MSKTKTTRRTAVRLGERKKEAELSPQRCGVKEANSPQEKLDELLRSALTLKEYRHNWRIWRIRSALNQIKRLNTLSYPIERETEGEYIPVLPPLMKGAINILDATMNTGKTHRIGEDYVKPWLADGRHVVVLVPLNSIGRQVESNWGILHISDSDKSGFRTDLLKKSAIVCCPDSINKLPQWFWQKPVLLVVDEASQVTHHICQGNTTKRFYSEVNRGVEMAAKKAIVSGGAIVLAEDGVYDRPVNFWKTLSGSREVRVIRHRKKNASWQCVFFTGSLSGYLRELLKAVQSGKRIFIATSSLAADKKIEKILSNMGVNVARIDSETNESGKLDPFFSDPDGWLRRHQPDVLVVTPTAMSGVSIQGNVSAEDAYFDEVWGYFPALSSDIHLQLLGRFRPPVTRKVFVPPFILRSQYEEFSPDIISEKLKADLQEICRLLKVATDPELSELEGAIVEFLSHQNAVQACQKSIAREALISLVEERGHIVTRQEVGSDAEMSGAWRAAKESCEREDADKIARAVVEEHHTLDWANETLSKDSSSADRLIAFKVLKRHQFPGFLFDDPEECYKSLTEDYGAMAKGVMLHAHMLNLEAIKALDAESLMKFIFDIVRRIHGSPDRYVKAAIMASLGILELLDGTPWHNEDPRALKVKELALKNSQVIYHWLRLQINESQSPVAIVNKLIRKLGLHVEEDHKSGGRGAQRRVYRLQETEPLRDRLLEAAQEGLRMEAEALAAQQISDPSAQSVPTAPVTDLQPRVMKSLDIASAQVRQRETRPQRQPDESLHDQRNWMPQSPHESAVA